MTLNNISIKGLDRLPRDRYEVASEIMQPDAILVRSANMHEMAFTDSLKAVGRAGAGVNNIPVEKLSNKGIPVFNAPGANANAVKELVVAGMLLACRNICQGWDFAVKLQGNDEVVRKAVEAGKKQFVGYELPGRVLGVIGLGAIGVKVANVAKVLGMKVIGYDPTITVERAWQLSSDVEQATSLDNLLSRSDFISFHVPLIEATENMINAERLRMMRDGVVILNFARSGIVDDTAVAEAIEQGKVYAYVCDFPNNIIKNHPRVISLPHLGASTREAEENCAVMVADQIREFLENGNISNSVNLPTVQLPRAGCSRMAVVNANVPDMVGKISSDLGKAKVNILHMVNESNGDLAYTMLDTETEIAAEILEKISVTEGVLKVRVL